MAYTQSGIERRRNISEMAQALSGAKHRTAELKAGQREGRKNRFFGLLGKGIDFAGGMARQKLVGQQGLEQQGLAGQQRLEQIGATGEQARLTGAASLTGMYGEGSDYRAWEMKLQEKQALLKAQATDPSSDYYVDPTGDVRATQFLVDWLVNADPKTRSTYFEMIRKGTITTDKDDEGLDGPSLIGAMHSDYLMGVLSKGEEPNKEGFRAWVNASIQPMPGFDNLTSQQRESIMTALEGWIDVLYGEEDRGGTDITREEGVFTGLPARQDKIEQELLQKVMEAQKVEMARVRSAGEAASIEQRWRPIIDEINQENYIGIRRLGAIREMIKKILDKKTPIMPTERLEDFLGRDYRQWR